MRQLFSILFLAIVTNELWAQQARDAEVVRLLAEVNRLYQQGKFAEATPIALRAVERAEKALGPEHSDTATSLDYLGELYTAQGAYDSAEPVLKRSLTIREKTLGPEHRGTAASLDNLAQLYIAKGAYERAEPLLRQALAIKAKVLGPDHPDTATSLINLAELYRLQGAFSRAEPLLQRALAIREKSLGADHPFTAIPLNNLALLYKQEGAYARAEPLYVRALAIYEKALGSNHPDTAASLDNLAGLYRAEGAYDRAESLQQRALAIYEAALGPNHPETAASLNNLAELYEDEGAYDRAAPLFERALAIVERAVGSQHPNTAAALENLASLYQNQGAYERAEPLRLRALRIYEQTLGPSHPDTAASLNNLASLYTAQKAYARAEPLFRRALAIYDKTLSPGDLGKAASLNNLAGLYEDQGAYDRAEPLLQQALAIAEKALGPEHPKTLGTASNLAVVLAERGADKDWPTAQSLFSRTLGSNREIDLLAFGKRTERGLVLNQRLATFSVLASRVPPVPDFVRPWRVLMLEAVLSGKGRTQEELRAAIEATANAADSNVRSLVADIRETWRQIGTLYAKGPVGNDSAIYRTELDQLYRREEDLLDRLSAASVGVRDARRAESQSSPQELAKQLRSGDVLVEVVRYDEWIPTAQQRDRKSRPLYGALVLNAASDQSGTRVDWVELGDAEVIDKLVTRYRRSVQTSDNEDVARQMQHQLQAAVWEPIKRVIGTKHRWLVSPDSSLRLISWNILVADKPGEPELVMLTSGRDLVRWAQGDVSRSADMVIGVSTFGDARAGGRFAFRDLPMVEAEVAAVRSALGSPQSEREPVTKSWLLTNVKRPRVLHLATHGYYQANADTEDPMLRAGIALEKANEQEEGRLSAKEAAGLNLYGTQLATLSACETGVGETNFADGLLGLQRSLAVAGARAQLLTLWPVNDAKTKEFMQAYYARLAKGEDKGEALRMVQSDMQAKGEPQHYWAPFVLYGESGPLR